MKKIKEISLKVKMAFAVLFAHHVVAFIDKGLLVTRYVHGLTEDEIEELKDFEFHDA